VRATGETFRAAAATMKSVASCFARPRISWCRLGEIDFAIEGKKPC